MPEPMSKERLAQIGILERILLDKILRDPDDDLILELIAEVRRGWERIDVLTGEIVLLEADILALKEAPDG